MKTVKLFVLSFLVLGIGACSSNPSPVAATTAGPVPENKAAYIEYADGKLEKWDNQVEKLAEPSRAKIQTNIADARIELKQLQIAQGNQWHSYRDRLESAFNRIETTYNQLSKK